VNSQFGEQHTGIIYTPPSYSDHVAVSALFTPQDSICSYLCLDEKDQKTKKSQPHKSQLSISSFFTKCDKSSTKDKQAVAKKIHPTIKALSKTSTKRSFMNRFFNHNVTKKKRNTLSQKK